MEKERGRLRRRKYKQEGRGDEPIMEEPVVDVFFFISRIKLKASNSILPWHMLLKGGVGEK